MAAYLVYEVVRGFDLIGSERVQGIFKICKKMWLFCKRNSR